MKVLGIETSVMRGTAAIVSDGKIVDEIVVSDDLRHSISLVPKVDTLLNKAGLTLNDIDLIAAGIGPGSFTGVRIGISFARGVSCALKKPLVGVTGFEAVLVGLVDEDKIDADIKNIITLFDARRGEFYCRTYKKAKNGFQPSDPDDIVKFDALNNFYNDETIFAGPELAEILAQHNINCDKITAKVIDFPPRAATIALMAAQMTPEQRKKYSSLEPVYLRKTQAEEKYETEKRRTGETEK